MYEQFGAVVHQDNKVEFKLFFPDNSKDPTEYVRGGLPYIKEIRVRGDFQAQTGGQNWELATAPVMTKTAHPKGWLYMCKVDQALAEGFNMHVIMDGVFNHVRAGIDPNHGFPYLWLYMDPADSPYIGAFARGGFFEEFDYHNGCVEEFIRDVCMYWREAFQIDGIRFDFTLGFFQEGNPNVGIAKLISDAKTRLAPNGGNNVMLTLEHLTDNRFDAIDDTNQICADGCWLDPFMFKSFEYASSGNIDGEILRILNSNLDYAQGKAPVTYIENHDHSTIVREAGGRGRWFKTQAPAISLLTSPGIVLLHNGQEFGEENFLPSDGPDRVQPRPLGWNNHSQDFAENGSMRFTKD